MTDPGGAQAGKVASLRELPGSIQPSRDLWPQIEARIRDIPAAAPAAPRAPEGARRAARLRWLAAAAMVASVAVGMWIGRNLLPELTRVPEAGRLADGQSAASIPAELARAVGAPSALDAAYVSDPRYERQRAALLRSLEARLATLPPAAREKVLTSLATIHKAKEDLETALGKDPGNALLQELLIDTYQDEMRVLTDVREASDSGRGI